MGRRRRKKRRQKSWNAWWTSSYGSGNDLTRTELRQQLWPLTETFECIDAMAAQVRRGGAHVGDLQELQKILLQPITIRNRNLALMDPAGIRNVLSDLCSDLHLEVHAMPDQFPCYLVCVISRHWDGPDIVLDELYLSPRNCFFPDSRFVMLSRNGRSRLFLRLSIFRDKVREYLQHHQDETSIDEESDDLLDEVGLLVLGAAWYEDQRLPFHVSDVFGLNNLRSAMELLGFILGSDLYKVKTALLEDDRVNVIDFFEHIYTNRPLAKLLKDMSEDKFINFTKLEERAKKAFTNLNAAFSDFLSTTDVLQDLQNFPLYKIILGLFFNLREVADRTFWRPKLKEAINFIEKNADQSSQAVLAALD